MSRRPTARQPAAKQPTVQPANYATKGDLAAYQPVGDYALKADLSGYQPKGDYALKADLSGYQPKGDYQLTGDYALRADLSKYQPTGDYALRGDLSGYQPKGDYALRGDLSGYQPKGDYQPKGNYQPTGDYALKGDLSMYQPKGNYQPTGDYALKGDLSMYQPKGDYQPIGDYALKVDLSMYQPKGNYQPTGDYASKADLSVYQPKGDYASKADLSGYQPKGEYQPKGDYQPKGEYQPKGDYVLMSDFKTAAIKGDTSKADLSGYQPKGDYVLMSDFKTGIKGDISTDANANVKGDLVFNGVNPWIIHTPDDNRRTMYIAPKTSDGKEWDWSKQTTYNADGTVNFANKISASGINTIRDTRKINSSPEDYYVLGQGEYKEFKEADVLNLPTKGGFAHLQTIVNWNDPSGGPIYQYAHHNTAIYMRTSGGTGDWNRAAWKNATWSSWTNIAAGGGGGGGITELRGQPIKAIKNDGRHIIQNLTEDGKLRHVLEADQNTMTVATFDDNGNWNGRHPLRIHRTIPHVDNYNDNKGSYALNAWGVKDGGWGVVFKNGPDRNDDGGKKTFTVRNDDGNLRLMANNGDVQVPSNKLCIGPKWCIIAEGDQGQYLVFRDMKAGKDARYMMSGDKIVNL